MFRNSWTKWTHPAKRIKRRRRGVRYVRSGQKNLRCGWTTGTCAALAASGAARLLLTGQAPRTLSVMTPKGWIAEASPRFCTLDGGAARCGVVKDAGDDPDITNG
ncbi:MAG: cobalt-precorrin-5B (C(1))-methyltransferase, partial [Oscillospiraceae bacterium]|nr:cobalt-precorrin-5B (C(1))-methyltransferase [Oscillospiraceae bacterium]